MAVPPPKSLMQPLRVREKLLMGPGPSNCPPRVLLALAQPVLGHFHEATFKFTAQYRWLQARNAQAPHVSYGFGALRLEAIDMKSNSHRAFIMDEVKEGIQYIFQTKNRLTLAISGSGHAGMEAVMCNLLEPGDKVLILVNGIWGTRAADMATRCGANVIKLETAAGSNFSNGEIEAAVSKHRPALLFVTQGESSTGVLQPVDKLGEICHRYDCLVAVDTVACLGGVPMLVDAWDIDCAYTGSQKVLGAPPGITPITFGPRAELKIQRRKAPASVYYLDMIPLGQYWNCYPGQPRVYHHTISTTLLYGLREALAMLAEEGLENCIRRHEEANKLLQKGLEKMGFKYFVKDPAARLTTIITLAIDNPTSWAKLQRLAMEQYDMEIAGGLGLTVGKVLRIGIMGQNARPETIKKCLDILEETKTQCQL